MRDENERIVTSHRSPLAHRCAELVVAFMDLGAGDGFSVFPGVAVDTLDADRRTQGEPAIVIDISEETIGFTSVEAIEAASMMQSMTDNHTDCGNPDCVLGRLEGLIVALLRGVEHSEKEFRKGKLS